MTTIQLKRGSKQKLDQYLGQEGELCVDADSYGLRVFDGTTKGGYQIEVVDVIDAGVIEESKQDVYDDTVPIYSNVWKIDRTGDRASDYKYYCNGVPFIGGMQLEDSSTFDYNYWNELQEVLLDRCKNIDTDYQEFVYSIIDKLECTDFYAWNIQSDIQYIINRVYDEFIDIDEDGKYRITFINTLLTEHNKSLWFYYVDDVKRYPGYAEIPADNIDVENHSITIQLSSDVGCESTTWSLSWPCIVVPLDSNFTMHEVSEFADLKYTPKQIIHNTYLKIKQS